MIGHFFGTPMNMMQAAEKSRFKPKYRRAYPPTARAEASAVVRRALNRFPLGDFGVLVVELHLAVLRLH